MDKKVLTKTYIDLRKSILAHENTTWEIKSLPASRCSKTRGTFSVGHWFPWPPMFFVFVFLFLFSVDWPNYVDRICAWAPQIIRLNFDFFQSKEGEILTLSTVMVSVTVSGASRDVTRNGKKIYRSFDFFLWIDHTGSECIGKPSISGFVTFKEYAQGCVKDAMRIRRIPRAAIISLNRTHFSFFCQ